MTIEGLIIWLVIGAIAGWLAGLIVKGYGFGLAGNIVVGIVGAFIAGWLLPRIGLVKVSRIRNRNWKFCRCTRTTTRCVAPCALKETNATF